jgi:hypothetical protein
MRTEYKYIHFELLFNKPKTKIWFVKSNSNNAVLGCVRWFPAWRQYCIFSIRNQDMHIDNSEIVFNAGCLDDISDFLKQANSEHKAVK